MKPNPMLILQEYLRRNVGECPPEIRFFDGNNTFSDKFGNYKADTLQESIQLFLKEKLVKKAITSE